MNDKILIFKYIVNNEVYIAQVNKDKFKLENLRAGVYKLWVFEVLHKIDQGTYSSSK